MLRRRQTARLEAPARSDVSAQTPTLAGRQRRVRVARW